MTGLECCGFESRCRQSFSPAKSPLHMTSFLLHCITWKACERCFLSLISKRSTRAVAKFEKNFNFPNKINFVPIMLPIPIPDKETENFLLCKNIFLESKSEIKSELRNLVSVARGKTWWPAKWVRNLMPPPPNQKSRPEVFRWPFKKNPKTSLQAFSVIQEQIKLMNSIKTSDMERILRMKNTNRWSFYIVYV